MNLIVLYKVREMLSVYIYTLYYLIVVFLFALISASRRFGSADDVCIYSSSMFQDGCMGASAPNEIGIWNAALNQASSQGRYYQIPFFALSQLIIRSETYTYVVKFGTALALLIALYALAKEFFDLKGARFATAFFAHTYSMSGSYNALTGFPGWFSFGTLCFLVSLRGLVREAHGRKLKIRSKYVFVFSTCVAVLSYELMVPMYSFCLIAILIFTKSWTKKFKDIQSTFKISLYILFLHLIAYGLFRFHNPTTYEGFELNLTNVSGALRTLIVFSLGGIIGSIYSGLRDLDQLSIAFFGATILSIIFTRNSFYLARERQFARTYFKPLMFFGSLVLLPNFIFALTRRYQDWSINDSMYLGALISHIFLAFVIAHLYQYLQSRGGLRKGILISSTALIVFLSSVGNLNYLNRSLQFNMELRRLQTEIDSRALAGGLSVSEIRRYDELIGTPSYRYFEAYLFKKFPNLKLIEED